MAITKCQYNWDDATVDVYFSDGIKISLLCEAVNTEIEGSANALGRLEALKLEKPLEYVRMVFDGTMQEYCDRIDRCNREQAKIMYQQYKSRYPDMSDMQIGSLIREIQMYDN